MMSAMVRYPCASACGAWVFSALASTPGLVSETIFSQKSTPTRFSWKMLWSNMYSAASPRLMIHSAMCGGWHTVGHVLRVDRARAVVVTADSADAAGDEVRVAGILALHEDRVAAEDRRRAVAFHHFFVVEVDLGVDAEAADDPGDGIPRHLNQLAGLSLSLGRLGDDRCHRTSLSAYCCSHRGLGSKTEQPAPTRCGSLRIRVWCQGAASAAPCRRCVP